MFEAEPISPEGLEWEQTGIYERVKNSLKIEAAVEGVAEEEMLRRRAERAGLAINIVSMGKSGKERKAAGFLSKLISKF